MGIYQRSVDLAVQLAQVCSVMLNVLFEQNKTYVHVCTMYVSTRLLGRGVPTQSIV